MDDFRATQASRNAWDFLSEDTIVSGFQKANMISTPPVDHVEQSVEIPDSFYFDIVVFYLINMLIMLTLTIHNCIQLSFLL